MWFPKHFPTAIYLRETAEAAMEDALKQNLPEPWDHESPMTRELFVDGSCNGKARFHCIDPWHCIHLGRKDMGCCRSHVAMWTFGRKHDRTENCSLWKGIQSILQTEEAGSLPPQDRCSHFQFHNRTNWNMVKGRGHVELDALFTRVLWNKCWQNSPWPTPTEFCTTPAFIYMCHQLVMSFWKSFETGYNFTLR